MMDLLSRLLDLTTLRLDGEGVTLGFERPIPAWAWGGLLGASLLVSLWSYWRLTGPVWGRCLLGCCRALLLLLLFFLISGPQLVQRNESVEKDWVLVLADRSASMTIGDAPTGDVKRRTTREEQLRAALESSRSMWDGLSSERVVQWMGFDAGAFDLGSSGEGVELGAPVGRRTSLGPALDQALARAAARPLAAVVILSDGRSVSEPSRASLKRLQTERVPVHTVPLGSPEPIADIAVRRVDSPRLAFVRDATPIRVELERLGSSGGAERALAQLVDQRTGEVLDQRRVVFEGDSATVILSNRPDEIGARTWAVRVAPEGTDLIEGNNSAEFAIELIDRPLRVLYIDGYPRWEQRYLRNMLIREKSINCSTLILAPDRRYIQEGDVEIDALPDSPERWGEYDAVMLGDVSPDVFTDEQLSQLRDHVGQGGGGLLWIGGPSSTPGAWFETPLRDLLPFTVSAIEPGEAGTIGSPVLLRPTATAQRLGLMQLSGDPENPWPAELADPESRWAGLRWAQRIDTDSLKPTAEVLAETDDEEGRPVVLSMRYGRGSALYVGTDEIWRWRYGRGEELPERFWVQMIRLLGRERLSRGNRSAVLELTPRRTDVEQPVRVSLELLDQVLAEQSPASIQVRLTRKVGSAGTDEPVSTVDLILKPDYAGSRTFAAIWLPSEPGTWTAEPEDPLLGGLSLSAEALVTLPDDELRHPETDHEALAKLSRETGGSVVPAEMLMRLPDQIPNRKVRLLNEVTETLWDTPLALMVLLILATSEWVGRRVIRLI